MILKQYKGIKSLITGAILIQRELHQCVRVIHIKLKFDIILNTGYLVAVESDNLS